jgi:ABC-type branched-subunit amino acid transport system substrate-binding protein
MNENNVKITLLTTPAVENEAFLQFSNYAENILIYTYPKIILKQKEFIEKYEKKYEKKPGPAASNSYDATLILLDMLSQNFKTIEEKKKYLDNNEFDSITFGSIKFDEKGYILKSSSKMDLKTIRKGEFVVLS